MVILKRIEDYKFSEIKEIINQSLIDFNIPSLINEDSKVFIKLNCVGPFDSSMGITTHPIILKAVIQVIKQYTNKIIVGDNPAVRDLKYVLKKCNLLDVINEENVEILNQTDFIKISNSNYKLYQSFEVSRQMIENDLIINLPKLKTHSLAYMTCAQKNFFGLIYGLNKSAWHVRASNPLSFGNAINDLYGALIEARNNKPMIHICDGILGLEGEGPSTGGKPKAGNVLLISDDAISLDRVAVEVVHLDYSRLFINKIANERNLGEGNLEKIEIKGNSISDFEDINFLAPKDSLTNVGLKILKFKPFRPILLEHPKVDHNKCIRCGECTRICPPHTMQIKKGKFPNLSTLNCIRCWCCAEVCPQNAIYKSKRPIIGRIILKGDKNNK